MDLISSPSHDHGAASVARVRIIDGGGQGLSTAKKANRRANTRHKTTKNMFASAALRRSLSSMPRSMSTKVAVLGASGGIGQPLSMLLKLSNNIDELSCYDIVGTPGVAADLSHVRCDVFLSRTTSTTAALSGPVTNHRFFISFSLELDSNQVQSHWPPSFYRSMATSWQ
jgi:hypothetical protein